MIIQTRQVEVREGSAPMSLHFDDADPVAECHVVVKNRELSARYGEPVQCRWHAHGDSVNDAVLAWTGHLAAQHRGDWE